MHLNVWVETYLSLFISKLIILWSASLVYIIPIYKNALRLFFLIAWRPASVHEVWHPASVHEGYMYA